MDCLDVMNQLIIEARRRRASDVHLTEGEPVWFRIHGTLMKMEDFSSLEASVRDMLLSLMSEGTKAKFDQGLDVDFSWQSLDGCRQRVNIFRERKHIAATIRLLNDEIPTLEQLKIPTELYQMSEEPRGLILITGPTGSGKSTTLAAVIESLNQKYDRHIITIEDPIEYVYENKKSLIHQREVGADVTDFASALRSSLREDPDVILVGEMRDYETTRLYRRPCWQRRLDT